MTTHPLATVSVLDQYAKQPFAPGYPADHRTFNSPQDTVAGAIATVLKGAQQSVVVAMYSFTLPHLAVILWGVIEAGLPTILVLDKSQFRDAAEQRVLAPILERRHRPTLRLSVGTAEDGYSVMHRKVCVVDNSVCITGSFNWSEAATKEDNQCTIGLWPSDAALLTASIEATYEYQIAHCPQF